MVDEIVNNPRGERLGGQTADQTRPEDRLREAIVTGLFQPSERLVET
ncbi:MAG: hypothetical protein JO363_15920, partial [Solirubrobacterales bacterium]|nr:hypothetical protein [Solirubrobacterales bacterium]